MLKADRSNNELLSIFYEILCNKHQFNSFTFSVYTFYDEVVIQESSQGETWKLKGIIFHEVETSDVICVQ